MASEGDFAAICNDHPGNSQTRALPRWPAAKTEDIEMAARALQLLIARASTSSRIE